MCLFCGKQMSLLRLTPVRFDLSDSFISWWHFEKPYLLNTNAGFQLLLKRVLQFTLKWTPRIAHLCSHSCHPSLLVFIEASSRLPPPSIYCIHQSMHSFRSFSPFFPFFCFLFSDINADILAFFSWEFCLNISYHLFSVLGIIFFLAVSLINTILSYFHESF